MEYSPHSSWICFVTCHSQPLASGVYCAECCARTVAEFHEPATVLRLLVPSGRHGIYLYYSHPLDCHLFCTWHIVMSARRSRRTSQFIMCIRIQIRQIISGMATHSPKRRFWNALHPRCMMNRDHNLARLTIHQQPSSGESILKFLIITGY